MTLLELIEQEKKRIQEEWGDHYWAYMGDYFELFASRIVSELERVVVPEEPTESPYVRNHCLPSHGGPTLTNAFRRGVDSCRSKVLQNLQHFKQGLKAKEE